MPVRDQSALQSASSGRPVVPGAMSVAMHAARFSYSSEVLFEALNVTLHAGTCTCLLGPSGVGKSTLLRLLAGLVAASPGDRIECSDEGSVRGRTAYMDQRDLLFPWLNVLDNVTLGARLRRQKSDLTRARELLSRVGLPDCEEALPNELSGGMRQRVALARTLMEDRPIVLMDEPFSALDALTRFHLQSLAAELLHGRTVLLVTHDPNEAIRLGHRIHVMSGRPAKLDTALCPPGSTPRDLSDEALRPMSVELMRRLGLTGESKE